MRDLKQKLGFTLIELLVVISIMVLIATILIINFNGQRGIRNLKIAQTQLATNVRKTQSYLLSARNVTTAGVSTPAKYYALQFDVNTSQYSIQSIDANYVANNSLETITLPQGIILSSIQYTNASGATASPATLQLAFAAPYAKLYAYASGDACPGAGTLAGVVQDPGCLLNLTDRTVVITLQDQKSGTSKTVTVYGVSGKVELSP